MALLPDEGLAGAVIAAGRLREAVAKPFALSNGTSLTITISVGVTCLRPDTADAKTLLAEADHALYASKQAGRNRVTEFTP